MTNQDNQNQSTERKIHLKAEHEHQGIPVNKDFYDRYYRDINAYRRKEQEHGRCTCPAKKRYLCNMDCWTCPYQTAGDMSSLNDTIEDNEGNEIGRLDLLPDHGPSIESIIEDQERLSRLFDALEKINPTYSAICKLWAMGKSEREIAKMLGIKSQSTVNYQRNQALAELRELLKDLI